MATQLKGSIRTLKEHKSADRPGLHELIAYLPYDAATGRYPQKSRRFHGPLNDSKDGKTEGAKTALAAYLTKLANEIDGVADDDGAVPALNGTKGKLFGDVMDEWLAKRETDARQGSMSLGTFHRYRGTCNGKLRPRFGDLRTERVTTRLLDDYYEELETDLAPATVANVHNIISQVLEFARRKHYIPVNVALDADVPALPPLDLTDMPEVSLYGTLQRAADEDHPIFGTLFWLAVRTLSRRGEVCALRRGGFMLDADPKRRIAASVLINKSIIIVPGGIIEKPTKTNRNDRIPLGDATVERVRAQMAWQQESATKARAVLTGKSYLFSPNPDGSSPYRPDTVSDWWTKLLIKIGQPHMKFSEVTRHFGTSLLLSEGEDPVHVAALGRWSSTRVMYKHYAHVMPTRTADIANRLDDLLSDY